ncbi:MAG: hypothetical protein Q8O89_03875 [Nanoarchaeota archaeon]|nr:hypothetical protein [Nanoarchaeota archaeon]
MAKKKIKPICGKNGKNSSSWEDVAPVLKKIWDWKPKKANMDLFNQYIKETLAKKELIIESARRFGTPQYILDEEKLESRVKLFCGAFRRYIKNSYFFYAFKSNDLPWQIKKVKEMGMKADVSGLFELQLALKIGFDKIIFTGPGKDNEELTLAIKNCDRVIINIDNINELERLSDLCKSDELLKKNKNKVRVGFRINPDNLIMQTWSKFGIDPIELKKAIEIVNKNKNLEWQGIQFHCSWNMNPSKYLKNIKIVSQLLMSLPKEYLVNLKFIDIGGGFYPEGTANLAKYMPKGTLVESLKEQCDDPSRDFGFNPLEIVNEETEPIENFASEISEELKKLFGTLGKELDVFLEPGRFISLHSSMIVVRVMSVKNERSVITDGGVSMVGDYRYEIEFAPIINLNNPSYDLTKKIIYGPTCDPNDYFGKQYFGQGIKEGDLLAIPNQGAYTFSCAWKFIKPIPPYVLMTKNKVLLIKKRESFENRYGACKF